eukprot:352694-Chlamydomonas_euryale.AAC.2
MGRNEDRSGDGTAVRNFPGRNRAGLGWQLFKPWPPLGLKKPQQVERALVPAVVGAAMSGAIVMPSSVHWCATGG